MERKIIQISDLHFCDITFSTNLKNNALKQIEDENPDLIIVSGDLTSNAYSHEYEDAANFINELKAISNVHVIPGNHDARNVGLIHFERLIGERKFTQIDENGGFAIIGLDSSQPDINDG